MSTTASAVHSTLPLVITTRVDVSQGKTISVQEFLRGLKRPGSKARTAKVHLITKNQDDLPSAAVKNDDLLNRISSTEDQSTSPPITKIEASNPSTLRLHGSSPTKPPENVAPQSFCSSTPAKNVGPVKQPAITDLTHPLDATKVVRTYERKSKPKLPPTEDLPDGLPLFCTQSSTANRGPLLGDREATSQVQELEGLSNHGLDDNEQRALRVVAPTFGAVVEGPSKKRRKTRAPVGELALVAQLPHIDSSGRESSEQGRVKRKGPNEANIGKPMTKFSRELIIPRRNSIDPQDFKFPPATPKTVRSSGWKPGSGFEGTTLQTLGPTTLASHRRPARRVKAVRFAVPPLRALDLSTGISPTAKASNFSLLQKAPESSALPAEATRQVRYPNQSRDLSIDYGESMPHVDRATPAGGTTSSQSQILTGLLRPRADVNQAAEFEVHINGDSAPTRRNCPSPQKIGADSPAIRRPSKSERNGWLKRRRRVGSVIKVGQHLLHSAKKTRQSDNEDGTKQLFEAHNATWYKEDAPADPCVQDSMQGQSRPTSVVHPAQIQTSRSSQSFGVQNSREQREGASPELGSYPIYPIQDAGLDVGRYFSNAVQSLSSKERGPHTVAHRRSQIQELGYGRQSEVEATLELGVTPRLKRTLSSVPFRPPFKNM